MIYLGADHRGYELKEKIKLWLGEWHIPFEDVGAHTLDPNDDYPQFAFAVAKCVAAELAPQKSWSEQAKGILVCRSAAGVIIAANKVKGIRAVAVFDSKSAKHSREHNDANVLGLSGDWMNDEEAKTIVKLWLETDFSNDERHVRRLKMIEEEEK